MPNEAESLPSHFLWNTIEAALRGGLCGFVATNAARSGDRKKKKGGRVGIEKPIMQNNIWQHLPGRCVWCRCDTVTG